jgi:hypothetical protein
MIGGCGPSPIKVYDHFVNVSYILRYLFFQTAASIFHPCCPLMLLITASFSSICAMVSFACTSSCSFEQYLAKLLVFFF